MILSTVWAYRSILPENGSLFFPSTTWLVRWLLLRLAPCVKMRKNDWTVCYLIKGVTNLLKTEG